MGLDGMNGVSGFQLYLASSLSVNIAYVVFERKAVPTKFRLTSVRVPAINEHNPKKSGVSLKAIWLMPWCFWMLPMTQLLQSGAAWGFGQGSADLIRMKGYTEAVAGFTSGAEDILPIVLTPCIGFIVDRFGHRFHLTAIATLF